jgi:fructosamine-3-kinase
VRVSAAPDSAAAVGRSLADRLGGSWRLQPLGSAFCDSWCAQAGAAGTSREALFVKSLPAAHGEVLRAEADGLTALAASGAVRTPAVVDCWTDAERSLGVLALEWLDLSAAPARDAQSGARFGARFGTQLAALHVQPPADGGGRFGWRRDNWLGGTPQANGWSAECGLAGWLAFFAERRLGAMATRLAVAGADARLAGLVARVIDDLPRFFDDGQVPRPSLIHGDLWSGNWGALADGAPVIFDPSVSVSDAEAELAMMELFGTPPAGFWPAYTDVLPMAPGYRRRRLLYQGYHLLNHALLFGAGYARQAQATLEALLRTAR